MIQPYIEMTNWGLIIRNATTGAMLTEILKNEYLDVRDGIYSDWILQLSDKTWITKSILYKLAEIFQKEYPQNNIDWKESLSAAERANGIWE